MFDRLTIVIPTYNRPLYLARLLNYFAAKKAPCAIHVLDSSDEDNKAANQVSHRKRVVQVLHFAHQ